MADNIADYLENKLTDLVMRGQAFTAPTTLYIGLFTVAETDANGGTEVSGGSYARVAITASLANWSGTQAAASTVASSGTSGLSSNNGTVTFPSPTAAWGVVVGFGVFDASSGGNLLWYGPLTANKTINSGDAAPSFQPGQLQLTVT